MEKLFHQGQLNYELLLEQIASADLPDLLSVSYAGFEKVSQNNRFLLRPLTAAKAVVWKRHGDKEEKDMAVPGELRFSFARDLAPQEQAALQALLAAHDADARTAMQTRDERQEQIRPTVVRALAGGWSSLTEQEKTETLRRACILLFRNVKDKDVDPI